MQKYDLKRFTKKILSCHYKYALLCPTLGSGFFIFGENQKIGSVFLLLFIIPTTIIFHIFPFHQRAAFMNLALIGALIISAIREPK